MAPPTPPIHRVYSKELQNAYHRGYPIFNPQPSSDETTHSSFPPVAIGDVGYIDDDTGDFITLFNIHEGHDQPNRPNFPSIPESFQCVCPGEFIHNSISPSIFVSENVTTQGTTGGVSGPFGNGHVSFKISRKTGAILASPGPIFYSYAISQKLYDDALTKYIGDWHRFVTDQLNIDLKEEDLILVTGVHLTTSWALAVFRESEVEAGLGLDIQFTTSGEHAGLASDISWKNTSGAFVNSGPRRNQGGENDSHGVGKEQDVLKESQSLFRTDRLPDVNAVAELARKLPLNTDRNQTLFIRRAKAKRRFKFIPLRLAANAESKDPLRDDEGSGSEGSGTTGSWNSTECTEDIHDLARVLDYILENSRANIAVARDSDLQLYSLAIEGDSNVSISVSSDGIGSLYYEGHQDTMVDSPGLGTAHGEPIMGQESYNIQSEIQSIMNVPYNLSVTKSERTGGTKTETTLPDIKATNSTQSPHEPGARRFAMQSSPTTYDPNVDYAVLLHNYLQASRQIHLLQWVHRQEVLMRAPMHHVTAYLGQKAYGTGTGPSVGFAKMTASYHTLVMLGQL